MNKKLFFSICLAALFAVTNLSAETTYVKVTSTPTDWTGTYLIVCEAQSVVFNGGADEDNIDAKSGPAIVQNIKFSGTTLAGTDALDAATFTISKTDNEDWPWAIQSKSGLYIGHKDSVVVDNGLSAETELKNKCKQKLSIDADGNFIATPQYSVGVEFNLQYNKKSDQMRFRYFVPGDKVAIQIYKLQDATGINSVSVAAPEKTVKMIENGQVIICKNGQKYNVLGVKIKN